MSQGRVQSSVYLLGLAAICAILLVVQVGLIIKATQRTVEGESAQGEQELYRTLIKRIQSGGGRRRAPRFNTLRFEIETVSGLSPGDSVRLSHSLRQSIDDATADSLIVDYRRANAVSVATRSLLQPDLRDVFLDSAATDSFLAPTPEKSDQPGSPNRTVMAVSRSGYAVKGSLALTFLRIRSPRGIEAESYVVAKRNGGRWSIADEIPRDDGVPQTSPR